jgi:hypothetical protein
LGLSVSKQPNLYSQSIQWIMPESTRICQWTPKLGLLNPALFLIFPLRSLNYS